MTRPVIGRGMYGMWGALTDIGEHEREFTDKVEVLGVDVGKSLYRDYQVAEIAADFNAAPPDAILLVWGFSLGANNCNVVASYTHRLIHGMWGFQASDDGAKVPIPSNVLFAHEVYNPSWLGTAGLGHYEWVIAPNNHRTNLYLSKRWDMHPGATERSQAMFLAEIERVIAKPGD
jgi:hypothetical protein